MIILECGDMDDFVGVFFAFYSLGFFRVFGLWKLLLDTGVDWEVWVWMVWTQMQSQHRWKHMGRLRKHLSESKLHLHHSTPQV